MNNLDETRNLQQKNTEHCDKLITFVNKFIIEKIIDPTEDQKVYIEQIKRELSKLQRLRSEFQKPPEELGAAKAIASDQEQELKEIFKKISTINDALKSRPSTKPPTDEISQSIPTTPVKHHNEPNKELLDKYVNVDMKLEKTKLQLNLLIKRMLSIKETPLKVALYSQIHSAQKTQASVQGNLDTIRRQLSKSLKSTNLYTQLDGQLAILERLEARINQAHYQNMPIAPTSKIMGK